MLGRICLEGSAALVTSIHLHCIYILHQLMMLLGFDGCLLPDHLTLKGLYTIRNRLPSGPSKDRKRIGQYFWLKWHFSSIYLRAQLPKPRATNKEDGIIAFDWPARSRLEMKCPVVSYRGQTSFVQPEKWGHFSSLSLCGYSSLSWMMPLNAQLP